VFRRIFGVPVNAASQLRAVLPPELAGRLDLGRLAPVPGSFVDEALRWRHSDVLFTAPLDGRDAFVYVLVEHQSSDDPVIIADLRRWAGQLRAVLDQPGGGEAFIVMLTYIELVSEAPVGELRDLAASLGPDAEEAYVTTAERLRAEGEARGKAEDILVVFEQRGIEVDDKSRELIESCTDLDTLNGWFRRAFKAGQASDLFAE
jgi:predicted transposase YdaD